MPPSREGRFNAEAFDKEVVRALRAIVTQPDMFAGTVAEAQADHERRAENLAEQHKILRKELANLKLQEGRLVDAITSGVSIERVKQKLEQIQREQGQMEGKIAECKAQQAALDTEGHDVDVFAELRRFFGVLAGGDGSEFVNAQGIIHAIVHHVELDRAAKEVSVALNLRNVGAVSNPQNEPTATGREPAAVVSPEIPVAVRPKVDGVAEGIRTPGLQSHSLAL